MASSILLNVYFVVIFMFSIWLVVFYFTLLNVYFVVIFMFSIWLVVFYITLFYYKKQSLCLPN